METANSVPPFRRTIDAQLATDPRHAGYLTKMLTQHLRELEDDGLIERRDFREQPPHVEYALTSAGRSLMPVLLAVREFSRDHPKNDDC